MNKVSSFFGRALTGVAAAGTSVLASGYAFADVLADTKTAIDAASGNAQTVGGYVIGGICVLIGVPLIIGMIHRMH